MERRRMYRVRIQVYTFRQQGDLQAVKEMTVFLKRVQKQQQAAG